MPPETKEKKLRRPVDEVRRELMADPTTKDIAEKLKMTVEAYVDKVIDYATHPEKQPQMHLLPENEVKAGGAATVSEVKEWLEKANRGEVDLRPEREKDRFVDPKKKL